MRFPGESTSRSSPNFKLGSCSFLSLLFINNRIKWWSSKKTANLKISFAKKNIDSKHHQRAIRTQQKTTDEDRSKLLVMFLLHVPHLTTNQQIQRFRYSILFLFKQPSVTFSFIANSRAYGFRLAFVCTGRQIFCGHARQNSWHTRLRIEISN